MTQAGDAADGRGKERGGLVRAAAGGAAAAAAGRVSCEGKDRLQELDALVRSDRISHMRDIFASAAPDDLYRALAAHDWDVQAACAAFPDTGDDNGDGRHNKQGIDVAAGSAAAAAEASSGLAARRLAWERTRSRSRAYGSWKQPAPAPDSRAKLWFDGVADELRGRDRRPFFPRGRERFSGERFYGNRR
ncbi:unnamed protein product [Laminaria digitata]